MMLFFAMTLDETNDRKGEIEEECVWVRVIKRENNTVNT